MDAKSGYTTIKLLSSNGPIYRRVSTVAPRNCRPDEIPVIDIGGIYDDADARKKMATLVKRAVEGSGFFYIQNHGIDEKVIDNALQATTKFFAQPTEDKMKVAKKFSKHFNGYSGCGTTQLSPSESRDRKEGFMWQYDPKFDPEPKDVASIPPEVRAWLRHEDFIWDGTSHIPGFQDALITYWQACLRLARSLAKVMALTQDLPEDYFDRLTTYPGADGVLNYYPALKPEELAATGSRELGEVGIGSHTDLQCFTLLWQDQVGGLQVLNKEDEWIKAPPIPGTLVVNIGDFLMRMSNDRFKSTVHRVYNRATVDRYSMPFFFGFNFNETCSVLPTCVDDAHPAKYEPISCGEWCRRRFQMVQVDKETCADEKPVVVVSEVQTSA